MSVTAEQPVWLRRVTQPGIAVFALMFALESLSRSTLAALIPLQAYAILHQARNVSLAYFAVSITGFCASFIAAIRSCSPAGSAVCSRIGSMMFCATDNEENNAPC